MNAATTAIPHIMTTDNSPPPPLFDDNHHSPNDSDIMHNYAIDTLFDPSYHTTDTEKIETKDALRARQRPVYCSEVDSLITSKNLVPIPTTVSPPTLPTSVSGKYEPLLNANVRSARKWRA
jgi:hypothetical protein